MPEFMFDADGEAYENGVIVALQDGFQPQPPGSGDWVIVAYGKYGKSIQDVFPITAETGGKAEVEALRDRAFVASYGRQDHGSFDANFRANCKHFTRVMPARDFLSPRQEPA